jgi:hypothetical protein
MSSIGLKILKSAYIYDAMEIKELNTKELVPKMVVRRRLTRAAKIALYLANKIDTDDTRIVYGSSFGELDITAKILGSISYQEAISPTHFQNSVYNTAVSYLSMINNNKKEIMTISSGDKTSLDVLKCGAIKSLDGDKILLITTETLNTKNIEEINTCKTYLEGGVALLVELSDNNQNIDIDSIAIDTKIPISLQYMVKIAQAAQDSRESIIRISI